MIENEHINFSFITRYVRDLVNEDLKELYNFAHDIDIPASKPETTKLIKILTMTKKPNSILELGTGIGTSSIVMAKASPLCTITTVEKDENNFKMAVDIINKNQLSERITVLNDDALEALKTLSQQGKTFDFIFLDSAKGQYIDCYPFLVNMLNKNGILISDNILYGGMVANDELVEHRKKTIVKRLRMYNSAINKDKALETVIVPIGDGISLSYKI